MRLISLSEQLLEQSHISIWKARNEMNPLGCIFQNKVSARCSRFNSDENLCLPIPGHPEVAANKLAQIWNLMNLNTAQTVGSACNLAQELYRKSGRLIK